MEENKTPSITMVSSTTEQISPASSSEMPKSHLKPLKIFGIVMGVLVILIVGYVIFNVVYKALTLGDARGLVVDKTFKDQTALTSDPTADWKTYTNSEYGYSLKHPSDITVTPQPTYDAVTNITKGNSNIGIVVILNDGSILNSDNPDAVNYYGHRTMESNSLVSMKIGDSKQLSPVAGSLYTVERLPDTDVNGTAAMSFKTTYDDDKLEFIYYIDQGKYRYVITYIPSHTEEKQPGISQTLFNQILSSFKITPISEVSCSQNNPCPSGFRCGGYTLRINPDRSANYSEQGRCIQIVDSSKISPTP